MIRYIFIILFLFVGVCNAQNNLKFKVELSDNWGEHNYYTFYYKDLFNFRLNASVPGKLTEKGINTCNSSDMVFAIIHMDSVPNVQYQWDSDKAYIDVKGTRLPVKFISYGFSQRYVLNGRLHLNSTHIGILNGIKEYRFLVYLPISCSDIQDAVLVLDGLSVHRPNSNLDPEGENVGPLKIKYYFTDFSQVPKADVLGE